ncbi:MAG: AsmA family protein [Desulfobacterales bacterium]|nr:AsmA family protein [Desulfobacterales bacterium]
MKKLKWILGVPAAIVAIALVVIALLLMSYDYNQFKAPVAEAVQKATGRTLVIGGDIGLKLGLTPALVVEDIRFQNADWGSRPDLASIRRFEVQVAIIPLLSKRIEIQRLIIVEPDILIETDARGRSNLEFKAKTTPVPKTPAEKPDKKDGEVSLPGLVFNDLRIEKGQLTYRDGKSGKTYRIALNRLDASAQGPDSPLSLKLRGTYQEAPLGLDATFGPLTGLTRKGTPWPLDLVLTAPDTELRVKGTVADVPGLKGFDLKIDLDCKKPSSLARLAEAEIPLDPPIRFSGRVSDPAAGTYDISALSLAVGGSDLSGSLTVALDGKRPVVTADLTSKKIDVREFIKEKAPEEKPAAKKPAGPPKEKVFPRDPLPVDALKSADARVSLKAASILLPKTALADLDLRLALKDGRMTMEPLTALMGGGKIAGRTTLTPEGKGLALASVLKVEQFDVGKMLKELAIFDLFEGKLDLSTNLKGSGDSVAAIMASLDGHVSVTMDGGRINNELIKTLGSDLSTGLFRLLNPFGDKEDWTAINCLAVRFDARKGLADASVLVFDTSVMSVTGKGDINLATEGLDLSLKPSPKDGLGVSGLGKINLSLGQLTSAFKLGGTLAKPKLAVDKTAAALAAGKALGGMALFGPVGVAGALVSGTAGKDENPCVWAVKAAKDGKTSKPVSTAAKSESPKPGTVQPPASGAGIFGNTLQKLLGD